jgi:hypothetical protein
MFAVTKQYLCRSNSTIKEPQQAEQAKSYIATAFAKACDILVPVLIYCQPSAKVP